jgi:hypothetical protein
MKKHLLPTLYSLSLLALLALSAASAQAKVWRIDNNSGAQADFTQATTAIADSRVVNGDTLYINGSPTTYTSFDVTKRLVIFGVGYFIDQNPNTQVANNTSTVGSINFRAASAGSEVQGMSGVTMNLYTSNISVRRNNCAVYIWGAGYGGTATISGIFVTQNWLSYFYAYESGSAVSNVFITNNYIYSSGIGSSPSGTTVAQNVVNASISTTNGYVYNNIMLGGSISGTGNSYNNNLCNGTQFPAGNGNQQNVNMTNVFLSTTTGSTDGRYVLKAGSPALAPAGINGEDCGMFGGSDPYVLSGMPPIPSIWFFSQPSVVPASGALQVRLKASSHN